MTGHDAMPPTRRRPIPGMTAGITTGAASETAAGRDATPTVAETHHSALRRGRHPATDYGTTRLVNFRVPVDLHDRYKALVRDAELRYPRLRRPSLTELVIALLEEGPETADEVADMIRRKRAAEHEER